MQRIPARSAIGGPPPIPTEWSAPKGQTALFLKEAAHLGLGAGGEGSVSVERGDCAKLQRDRRASTSLAALQPPQCTPPPPPHAALAAPTAPGSPPQTSPPQPPLSPHGPSPTDPSSPLVDPDRPLQPPAEPAAPWPLPPGEGPSWGHWREAYTQSDGRGMSTEPPGPVTGEIRLLGSGQLQRGGPK